MDAEDWKFASAELDKPLDGAVVKSRTQGRAQVSYVEGWHVIAEANRIFGFNGWMRETVQLTETNRDLVQLSGDRGPYQQWRVGYLCRVRITVDGVIRDGVGFGTGMSKPEALGEAVESAAKEAETDAMKRAFVTFGNPFGLALYDKTQANVDHGEPAKPEPRRSEPAPATPQSNPEFERLKEALEMCGHERAIAAWIEEVKLAVQSGAITMSQRATLASLRDNKLGMLAQRPAA